jgi:hypothetical protein
MSKKEAISFFIQLHTYNGEVVYNALKTDEEMAKLKDGDVVAILLPFNKVDPLGAYREVITSDQTFNAMHRYLVAGEKVALTYKRPPLQTYMQEKADKIQLTKEYLKSIVKQIR